MGFGYLFAGTVLTVNVVAHGYTDLIAYLLILIGMLPLSEYGTRLRIAKNAAFPLLFVGACEFALNLLDLLGIYSDKKLISEAALLNHIMLYIFTFLLLRGLSALAEETDVLPLRARALRNQIFAFLYHVPMALMQINFGNQTVTYIQQYAVMPFMIFGIVYLILQAKLIYSYYMWICPEGGESMERRSSRFGFINRINAFSERVDERTVERKREERMARDQRRKEKEGRKKKKK